MKHSRIPIQETGIILWVKNYEKCVRFYSEKLGLRIRFKKPHLTNFDFGGSYLLIEKGRKKSGLKNCSLRLNVQNVSKTAKILQGRGLKVNVWSADWGDIGQLRDPDGNPIELCKWK